MEQGTKPATVDPLLNPLEPDNGHDLIPSIDLRINDSTASPNTKKEFAFKDNSSINPPELLLEKDVLETTCLDYNDAEALEDGNTHEYHFSQSNISNEARYNDYTSHNSILGLLARVKRLPSPGRPTPLACCGRIPTRGCHILLWSLVCAPIAALGSGAFALYYSALTLYAVYDYYVADARALCPVKLPALLALVLAWPAFGATTALALALYAAVAQITCDAERWARAFFDWEKGFFGALCGAAGLEHCCPYDATLARDTRRMKAAASNATAGAHGDSHRYTRGAGLSMIPTNNIDEIANISGQPNMLDPTGPETYFTARIVTPPPNLLPARS